MNKLTAIFMSLVIISGIVAISSTNVFAADQTIDCKSKDCKINFKGKNDVDIIIGAGSQGPKGDKGDTGDQGPAGNDGKDGNDGANGTNGVDGKDGVNGTNGQDGKDANLTESQTNALNFIINNQEALQTVIEMLNNGTLSSSVNEVQ